MNWIKSNPFVSALAGITLVISAALYFLASKGGAKYETAKTEFDESYGLVNKSEGLPLYPTLENRDGKRKALGEYRESIGNLSGLFGKYRAGDLANITPQDFTVKLKAANAEVSKALRAAGSTIPDGFLLGFEKYGNEFATEKSTGVLQYQLEGLKHAMLKLAAARPSEVTSVFREELPEESGAAAKIAPNEVCRRFGYEIAFKGSEAAARAFITSLGETDTHYYTVRCVKIENESDSPPKVSDAKFERPRAVAADAADADNPFGGAFVLPGDEAAPAEEEVVKEEEAPAEVAAAPADSGRILAQVLGSEELEVFVRFDLMMFLADKPLPKP